MRFEYTTFGQNPQLDGKHPWLMVMTSVFAWINQVLWWEEQVHLFSYWRQHPIARTCNGMVKLAGNLFDGLLILGSLCLFFGRFPRYSRPPALSISDGRKDDMTLCSRCRRGRDISLHTNRPAFDTSSPEFNIVSSLFVCPEFDLASSKRTEMLGKSTTKVDQAKETTMDFHGISWGIPFILMSPRCWRSRTTWRPTWRICHRARHRDPKQTPLVPHPSPQRQSLRRHLKVAWHRHHGFPWRMVCSRTGPYWESL